MSEDYPSPAAAPPPGSRYLYSPSQIAEALRLRRIVDQRFSNDPGKAARQGEVGELVADLRRICFDVAPCDADAIDRAADLLEQRHPAPVPVSERPWEREGWCDVDGRCWLLTEDDYYPQWRFHSIKNAQLNGALIMVTEDTSPMSFDSFYASHCLPAHALPLPAGEVEP